METKVLVVTMRDALKKRKDANESINHCLVGIERKCEKLISDIAEGPLDEAKQKLEEIYDLQGVLSNAVFSGGVCVSDKMMRLIREFEALHDPEHQDMWVNRIRAGCKWP